MTRSSFEQASPGRVESEYICHIHEVGEAEGKDFISMEYVQGETLKEELAQGPLSLKDALQKAGEIAEALDAAHKHNIVHRDLKPANTMLTPDWHVKVNGLWSGQAAFPCKRCGESRADHHGQFDQNRCHPGHVGLCVPRTTAGEDVDTRSDIFSFGIVLYEMLRGIAPFKKPQPMETSGSILKEDPLFSVPIPRRASPSAPTYPEQDAGQGAGETLPAHRGCAHRSARADRRNHALVDGAN